MQENKENDLNNLSAHSVLNAFDFTAIDEMDPSLGKYRLCYLIKMDWKVSEFKYTKEDGEILIITYS